MHQCFDFKKIWQCKTFKITLWLWETNDTDALRDWSLLMPGTGAEGI